VGEKIKEELAWTMEDGELAYKEIVSTNVPLIKYIDKETRLNCDVIINGVLGVKNSELIKSYAEFDDRFLKVGILLKFWGKHF
jgi:DNA polymerase sigma